MPGQKIDLIYSCIRLPSFLRCFYDCIVNVKSHLPYLQPLSLRIRGPGCYGEHFMCHKISNPYLKTSWLCSIDNVPWMIHMFDFIKAAYKSICKLKLRFLGTQQPIQYLLVLYYTYHYYINNILTK